MEVPDFDLKKQKIATLTKKKIGCKSAKKSKNNHKSREEKT